MLAVVGLASAAAAQEAGGWRTIYEEQGIVVSTREQPGHQLPSFRGVGELKGSVLHLLAIVLDDARTKEWAKDADETEVLKQFDPRTVLIYSRSHQTWPIRDRDLIMKRSVEVVKPGEAFRVRLICVTGGKPEGASAIRIKDCETVFVLRKVDQATTRVEYSVRAEPGGSNPAWAVRWASKSIPLETLVALQKQVNKTRGQYDDAIRTWASAR